MTDRTSTAAGSQSFYCLHAGQHWVNLQVFVCKYHDALLADMLLPVQQKHRPVPILSVALSHHNHLYKPGNKSMWCQQVKQNAFVPSWLPIKYEKFIGSMPWKTTIEHSEFIFVLHSSVACHFFNSLLSTNMPVKNLYNILLCDGLSLFFLRWFHDGTASSVGCGMLKASQKQFIFIDTRP